MANLFADTAFDIESLNFNWFLGAYQSETMMPSVIDGYEDNYVLYTVFDEALVMAGRNFNYDATGAPTIGTIEAFGETHMDAGGYWWDDYWIEGLNLPMSDMVDAILNPLFDDDLALIRKQFSGKDNIYLSEGADSMNGFKGADKIYGYGGGDTLNGGSGNDKVYGGAGSDKVSGGSGNDKLVGGADNDTLKGGSGDDLIRGGTGRDKEYGGKGEDTFVFATGDDKAIIRDFDAKGKAHDLIDLSGLASIRGWNDLTQNHMEKDGSDVRIDAGDGDVIVLHNVTLHSLDKGDFLF